VKAISPVIATVIIVAVAIAISIAVALWMTGITTTFTGLEKLEIVNAYAEPSDSNKWTIHITIKNTGTKDATIDDVFINNVPKGYNFLNLVTASTTGTVTGTGPFTLKPGATAVFTMDLSDGYTPGQTISIVVHTASGGQYPATVTLP